MTDNAGATDSHRALNYLAMRYPGIYARASEQFARDSSLTAVDVLPSPLSGIKGRRRHLLLHEPQVRFHGEVFRARGWD